MKRFSFKNVDVIAGITLCLVLGLGAYLASQATSSPLADPLIISLLIGIVLNRFLQKFHLKRGFQLAPLLFLPLGILFYGFINLDYASIISQDTKLLMVIIAVMLAYVVSVLLVGRLFSQKKEISYLTATGSAVCGASAIAVIAPAIDAQADDVSIAVIAVAVVGLFAIFMATPLISYGLSMSNEEFAIFSGSVIQFTGFVKASVGRESVLHSASSPAQLVDTAVSTKALRYFGLIAVVPLFASLMRRRISIPWFLWAFVLMGVVGTAGRLWLPSSSMGFMIAIAKPVHSVLWSTAMVAIGLNMDIRKIFSNNGLKAIAMAMIGFVVAAGIFLVFARGVGL